MSPELRTWERKVPELVNEGTHTLFLCLQPDVIPIPSLEESVMNDMGRGERSGGNGRFKVVLYPGHRLLRSEMALVQEKKRGVVWWVGTQRDRASLNC